MIDTRPLRHGQGDLRVLELMNAERRERDLLSRAERQAGMAVPVEVAVEQRVLAAFPRERGRNHLRPAARLGPHGVGSRTDDGHRGAIQEG